MDIVRKETKPVINLVCGINENYILPFAVMLFSLLTNRGGRYHINLFIIEREVSDYAKEKLDSLLQPYPVSVTWIRDNLPLIEKLPIWGRIKRENYYSVLVADLLPDSVEKALFLDTDLLVIGDVEEIWEQKLDGKLFGAVQDMAVPVVSHPRALKNYDNLGLNAVTYFFNTGVILFDLVKWRRQKATEKVINYLIENRERVGLADQEGFNAVLSSSCKALDLKWNIIASVAGRGFFTAEFLDKAQYEEAMRQPHIIHYAGYMKPWLGYLGNRYDNIYKQYLEKQNWFEWHIPRNFNSLAMGFYDRHLRDAFYPIEKYIVNKRYKLVS